MPEAILLCRREYITQEAIYLPGDNVFTLESIILYLRRRKYFYARGNIFRQETIIFIRWIQSIYAGGNIITQEAL